MINIIEFFSKQKAIAILSSIFITLMGVLFFVFSPKESLPEIKLGFIVVKTIFPNSLPEEVEKIVTVPIEDALKNIKGIKEINSTSYSELEAEWFGLLNDLLNCGLSLKQDGIIIHDGAKGLISAIDTTFTYHKKQLCVFHFIQSASFYAKNLSLKKIMPK